MLKRYPIILMCILLIISTLTGCIQAPAQGDPGGDAQAVLSVWYSLNGKEEKELLSQLERISQENNEFEVRGERIPETDFVDYIWKIQAGGQGPDILISTRPILSALYEKGAVSPVLAERDKAFSSAEELFTFNHELYAAPWLTDVPLLFYRKDQVKTPPYDINEIWIKKASIAVPAPSTVFLSPWWKAEGGNLSMAGIPQLNSPANLAFLNRLIYLRDEGLLIFDNQAMTRLVKGEVNYAISWASQSHVLENSQIEWDCVSLETVFGNNGKALLDKTIGIANSSLKTTPARESAILIILEELLKTDTQIAMSQAGNRIPVSKEYFEGSPITIKTKIAKTISNSWVPSTNLLEWQFMNIQDSSWLNILAGSDTEIELEKAQQSALELLE
ncbi:MAG: hypothetical protein APF84_05155 [Gracilibacter sp. BRH_c7a]|nr:MAG: hypothetical protein APF84_05155 [Gracilibacter sp. BRH_c7a]